MGVVMAILAATPVWVWPVLACVVWMGLRAARPRVILPATLLILPCVFLLLSLRTLLDGGGAATAFVGWLSGLLAGAAAGWAAGRQAGARREGTRLHVPGSWIVLPAALTVFGVQYATGYLRAVAPATLQAWPIDLLAPAAAALGTGFLAGRAVALLASRSPREADAM